MTIMCYPVGEYVNIYDDASIANYKRCPSIPSYLNAKAGINGCEVKGNDKYSIYRKITIKDLFMVIHQFPKLDATRKKIIVDAIEQLSKEL